eukprot:6067352-Amphidinium_carterae.1
MIALQRLHVRWFHAPIAHMTKLLTAAGVQGPAIIKELPQVVSACHICRKWARPGPRTMTHIRLVDSFNTEVQVDLLFYPNLSPHSRPAGARRRVDCTSHH